MTIITTENNSNQPSTTATATATTTATTEPNNNINEQPSAEAIASLITQVSPPADQVNTGPSTQETNPQTTQADQNKPSASAEEQQHQADSQASIINNTTTIPPEEPSTASREGTYHTTATTADQTLVDNNDSTLQITSDQSTNKPLSTPEPDPLLTSTTAQQDLKKAGTTSASKPKTTTTTTTATSPQPCPPSVAQAKPPPANPTTSQAGPSATPTKTGRQPKTPTRKKLIRFLLPCFHPSLHDDHSTTISKPPPRPTTQDSPGTTREMSERVEPTTTSSLQPSGTTTSRRSPIVLAKQHLRKSKNNNNNNTTSRRSSTNLARRTPSSQCLPTPVSDTVTPAGAAAATSAANAHGGAGVQVPMAETEGVLSGAVVPPGKDTIALKKSISGLRLVARTHSDSPKNSIIHQQSNSSKDIKSKTESSEEEPSSFGPDDPNQTYQDIEHSDDDDEQEDDDDEEDRIVAMGGMGIPLAPDGSPRPLLAPLDSSLQGRKCLVLDLDETLVHSSFKVIPQSDFVVPVEIENSVHNVHVIKRPGVDEFMRKMGEIYEVVVFTASLSKYADPVLDMLDIHHVVKHRLFRESCYNHKGNYVKDLSQLGRPISDTIIIDNSPASYVFHPNNAVPVSSWFNDPHDTELTDLAAFLTDIANVPDVRGILDPRL
ncbi:hypothetical protein PGT21_015928 [Puccinia graminis f. sp. tritici]|uniref:FCP1 homology domain-containing protein n=1 Tax=Puccinia graminis f. sp. tritici TaxID=56615 RepID=A0A5B0QUU0_PUCGR|nr:hypothetical protein PGT21_015928 [Puccinia graminis f. sp. tritici]